MSIKKNFLYSSLLTVSGYIIAFITFPHVSRALGVTNLGTCNFIDSIVNYVILFSMLGINTIGIREIAKNKGDKVELTKTFNNIICLNLIFTLLASLVYVILIFSVDKLYAHKELMFIGLFKILFNVFMVEWFFKGIEDFKYITSRSLLIKVIYAACIFIFIKKPADYTLYYVLTVSMIVFNAIIDWRYIRTVIQPSFKNLSPKEHIKPILIVGVYLLLTSMYTSFNVAYLGFTSGEKEVGYYTTATKLYAILLSLFTAFTGVMLPRMSSLIAEGKLAEFERMVKKSVDVLFSFSIPLVIITVIFSSSIISLLSGPGYEGAIVPMTIVMPLMIIIGYEQILVTQILMPLKKDREILINSILGALIGLGLNIFLVSKYKSSGSAMVWVFSEVSVLICAQYFVSKAIKAHFPYLKFLTHLLAALPAVIICYSIRDYVKVGHIAQLLLATACIGLYYLIVQLKFFKNELIIQTYLKMLSKST